MGCASSTEASAPRGHAEAARASLVVATAACFCADKPSTLYMKERCWSLVPPDEDFLIRQAESSREVFCVQGSTSPAAMKTLREAATREPVAHLKRDSVARAPTYNVFAAGPVPSRLFSIEVQSPERPYVDGCGCAIVEFSSPETGEAFALGVDGDWRDKRALLWIERRDRHNRKRRVGRRQDAARVYRPAKTEQQRAAGEPQNDYFVGIAADMDMALVMLVCMALDDASRETAAM